MRSTLAARLTLGLAVLGATLSLAAAPAAAQTTQSSQTSPGGATSTSTAGVSPTATTSPATGQTTSAVSPVTHHTGAAPPAGQPPLAQQLPPAGPPPSATTEVQVGNTTSGLEPGDVPKAVVVTHAVAPPSAAALQTPVPPQDLDPAPLTALSQAVTNLQTQASQAKTDASLAKVKEAADAAESSATSLAATRARTLAILDAQLKKLSTKSGAPRPHVSAEEASTRKTLLAERAQIFAQIKAAETAASTAGQTYAAVAAQRRNSFTSKIFERTASPLEQSFWTSIVTSLGPDTRRLFALLANAANAMRDAPEPRGLISVVVALAIAAAIAIPVRRRLKAFSRRRSAKAGVATGLRQSAHALGAAITDTLLPGMAAVVLNLGFTWGEMLSDQAEALARALVIAVFWGAAVLALSRQLAGSGSPEERLLPVSDRLASRMRVLPWLVALITGAGFLLNRINVVVGASVAATIAANCIIALAYAAVASLVLLSLGGSAEAAQEEAEEPARAPVRVGLSLALSAAIVVTVVAVFAGFSTLAAVVSRQIFWFSVVAAVTYLLLRFIDDLIGELFRPQGWIGRTLIAVLNLRNSTVQQLAVLTSGVLQVMIVLSAISFVLTPFGGNGELLSSHLLQAGHVIHVGSITISPRSIAAALASLVVGLAIVHFVERWLDNRFLPVTEWDSGVQNSVSTGVRYLGIALAVLWALAAAGLGFKQIALVASALSVGIGFGLQQIVQNFVSGLILLVERPVKVGDWVNLGGVEGDVRRIRVRATEIQTFDRTTVIVPNSDLITKQVQNKTLGDPRGRVTLKFSIGAAADAPRATELALKLLKDDPDVLNAPEPRVFIESLTDGGSVNYVCYAYIASPRNGMSVRSKLYGELIALFGKEKIGFIGGPGVTYIQPGDELKAFVIDLIDKAHQQAASGRDAPQPSA